MTGTFVAGGVAMALSAVKNWFGRPWQPVAEKPPLVQTVAPPLFPAPELKLPDPSRPPRSWSRDRLTTTDGLWGDGYQFPGGEIETLRLAKPLGLSAASSLLLLGAGGGGAPCAVATQLGAWVSGFDVDPELVAAASERILHRNLSKRAQVETWNPDEPNFRPHFYHHGLALEALRGKLPERTLAGVATALKPSGQLAMIEAIADVPLDPADPIVAAWARLERRDPATVPTEVAITRILRRLRFDVRVTEDLSERHMQQTMAGWRTAVGTMEHVRPTRRAAMRAIEEAELWMLRMRLFQVRKLRLVRWHAIGGG
jgi:cyclopropane fatty-acyl-phospholipid synthase-like methyltransferase